MAQPQFVPSPLKIIERRRCQNCGATLIMTGIAAIIVLLIFGWSYV
jgi:hypothetical protein